MSCVWSQKGQCLYSGLNVSDYNRYTTYNIKIFGEKTEQKRCILTAPFSFVWGEPLLFEASGKVSNLHAALGETLTFSIGDEITVELLLVETVHN